MNRFRFSSAWKNRFRLVYQKKNKESDHKEEIYFHETNYLELDAKDVEECL